ncbi:tetratricopeptide repeat protein [Patulibacter sp. SYSU D01012]|uniref:tetratricopeptide repeat protein n=1 Tax=Patulibacter sp. SYSU D01012 TaxID=2817381 RepID=UPI001B304B72|nr:tetratricopeptide repeat protein [Patulibacter sp. SYSU D01012]
MAAVPDPSPAVRRLDALDAVPSAAGVSWSALRDAVGFTGAAANVFRADGPGVVLVEPHDETTSGAAGHDELYVVLTGHAVARVDGAEHDAPAGTLLRAAPGTPRELVAQEAGTTVLVVGGAPGAAGPPSAWTRWTRAYARHEAGDTAGGIAELEAAHRDHPGHPLVHYHLACLRTATGELARAREHLAAANAGDPRTVAWARRDDDLAALRADRPGD